MLKTGLLLALAGGTLMAATAAGAQDRRYDDYMAHRAGRGAAIHACQASRDQRAADTAVRRAEARHDSRFARHERHAMCRDHRHGGGWVIDPTEKGRREGFAPALFTSGVRTADQPS